jgi:hypothetical protein
VTDTSVRRPGPLAFLLAALVAVLAAAAAGLIVRGSSSTFTSTALVSIDEPRAVAAAGDGGVIDKLSRIRFKYAGLVPTDKLAAPVAQQLGVPIEQVRGRLSASVHITDLLLRLSCVEPDAGSARRCSDALATSMVAFVAREQSTNGIPPDQRLVMAPVQAAGPAVATGPRRTRTVGAAGLAGALGAAVVLGVAARPRS